MDSGSRKIALASLLIGGAVSADKFEWAFAAFALYVVANVVLKYLELQD
jgi:hypothetical protein